MRAVHTRTGELVLLCVVPFCNRTTRKFPHSNEMICADHWKPISMMRKKVWARAKRKGLPDETLSSIWSALKCEAIEIAAGIRK